MATLNRRPRSGPQAIDAPAIAGLRARWDTLAKSRRFRQRLGEWATAHPTLAEFADGEDLMASATSTFGQCDVLEAIATEAIDDEMAMTATLCALLPRLVHLVNRSNATGLDLDERCATVMAIAHETVVKCRPGTASSWYDRRLWCNISKRYNRWINAQLAHADATPERLGSLAVADGIGNDRYDGQLVAAIAADTDPVGPEFELAELCDWVAHLAQVDFDTARLIVLTRAGGVPVEDLVGTDGASAQSIRQRRLRAERRLASALAAA